MSFSCHTGLPEKVKTCPPTLVHHLFGFMYLLLSISFYPYYLYLRLWIYISTLVLGSSYPCNAYTCKYTYMISMRIYIYIYIHIYDMYMHPMHPSRHKSRHQKKNMRLIGDFLELFGQLGILSADLPREAAFHAMPGHYRLRMRKNSTWHEKAKCKCEGKKGRKKEYIFFGSEKLRSER